MLSIFSQVSLHVLKNPSHKHAEVRIIVIDQFLTSASPQKSVGVLKSVSERSGVCGRVLLQVFG